MIAAELDRLLQACKDEPDEDAPRLILSDWLEEHGQSDRAEFVRLQLKLARKEINAGEEAAAEARVHDLFLRHAGEWLGGLRTWPGQCTYRRGLIQVHARLETLRDHPPAEAFPDVVPWLETLVLEYGRQQGVADLVALPALAHFSRLDLTDVNLAPPWLQRLVGSPAAAHLRGLRLSLTGSPRSAGETLARSPHLGGLRMLDFHYCMGDACLTALAGAPVLANLSTIVARYGSARKGLAALARSAPPPPLRRLRWYGTQATPAGLRELARSPVSAGIEELQLEWCDVGRAGLEALAERAEWPRLERLTLTNNDLGDEGVRLLAGRFRFPALRRLCLTHVQLSAAMLRELLAAPWAAGLSHLELGADALGEAGVRALADAPVLGGLCHLDVSGCGIPAKGLRALANSPHLTSLQTLLLCGNALRGGLDALADARGLPALTALSLRSTGVKGDDFARFVRSGLAGRLRQLDLATNHLTADAIEHFVGPTLARLQDLRLDYNPIGEGGMQALANAPFHGLVRLHLANCRIGRDAGLRALLSTHGFMHLSFLDLYGTAVGDRGEAILARWPRLGRLARLTGIYGRGSPRELLELALPVTNSAAE